MWFPMINWIKIFNYNLDWLWCGKFVCSVILWYGPMKWPEAKPEPELELKPEPDPQPEDIPRQPDSLFFLSMVADPWVRYENMHDILQRYVTAVNLYIFYHDYQL